jgi:hypothetical protein
MFSGNITLRTSYNTHPCMNLHMYRNIYIHKHTFTYEHIENEHAYCHDPKRGYCPCSTEKRGGGGVPLAGQTPVHVLSCSILQISRPLSHLSPLSSPPPSPLLSHVRYCGYPAGGAASGDANTGRLSRYIVIYTLYVLYMYIMDTVNYIKCFQSDTGRCVAMYRDAVSR